MRHYLFEIAFDAGTEYWTPSAGGIDDVGGHDWTARKFKFHDLVGAQDSRPGKDGYTFILIDADNWPQRAKFRANPVGILIVVSTTDFANGAYSTPAEGYRGVLANIASVITKQGKELHVNLRPPGTSPGRAAGYPLVDEFQRQHGATDNVLATTHITQTGSWSGVE